MFYQSHLSDELIVDNFAGGGGASTGIEAALQRPVDIAINHDPKALALHEVNHPHTKHFCESVWDVDPLEVTQGRPVGVAWFSPDCKHFSKAKGSKPVSKKIRGLAWVVLRWAAKVKPRVIFLENVEEFTTWGPIGPDGKPCPENKGRTFNSFINALKRQGYQVEYRELKGCDYGAPTIRKRLFMIARCDGKPIVWPQPTHGPEGSGLLPYRTAAECIDWSKPAKSIFGRKKPLAEKTMKRIAAGIEKYVFNCEKPFIIPVAYGERKNQAPRTHDIDAPLPTVVGKGTHALVTPFLTEFANASNQRNFAADESLRTQCAEVKGGHFALVAPFLAKYYTGVVGQPMDKPTGTVTCIDHHSLVTSHITKFRNNCIGHPNTEPMHTLTSREQFGEVRAFLVKYYGASGAAALNEPSHTVTTKDRFGLVTIEGEDYQIADIGLRMLAPRELYRAQGFPESYIIDRAADGSKLSKKDQVRMCGNSVCPPLAQALVEANVAKSSLFEQDSKTDAA